MLFGPLACTHYASLADPRVRFRGACSVNFLERRFLAGDCLSAAYRLAETGTQVGANNAYV